MTPNSEERNRDVGRTDAAHGNRHGPVPDGPQNLFAALGTPATVDTIDGPVRVYSRGSGSTIVFVHGLFANAAAWRKVVPLLADSHRCVTIDVPFGGHRLPMKPGADLGPTGLADIVAEVLVALDLDEVTLVGNDGGGLLSQLLITRRPERVSRLVLTPCDTHENLPPPLFSYLCVLARIPGATEVVGRLLRIPLVRHTFGRLPIGFAALIAGRVDNELIDHYLYGITRIPGIARDVNTFLRAVDRRLSVDAARRFPSITIPTLIAWTREDSVFPRRYAERLAREFPHARLRTIDNARTWVAEDQPAAVAGLIGEFTADPLSATMG